MYVKAPKLSRFLTTLTICSNQSVGRWPAQSHNSRGASIEVNHEKSELEAHEQAPLSSSSNEVRYLKKKLADVESELHDTKIKAAKSLRQV